MSLPFSSHTKDIADDMGISLYQRFSLDETSLFLNCSEDELQNIVDQNKIDCIHISVTNIQFFGYQLVSYLLDNSTHNIKPVTSNIPERIIRSNEVEKLSGLSRTTIWRKENENTFPKKVSLGGVSVGWKLSEVQEWINSR